MVKEAKETAKEKKEKRDPMDIVLANIEKSLGNKGESIFIKGTLTNEKVETISFGIKEVDDASFCAGIPRGKMIEIFGMESGGKSYLSLKLIASAQKMGLKCCLVDVEQSFDPIWAAQQGVKVDELYIINAAMSAEKTLDYMVKICLSGAFGLVVLDSTAALVPQKELGESVGDQNVALLARAMSVACRKIVNACAGSNTTCLFLNQLRDKIGVTWGDPTTTPGGKALKFYSHQRVQVTPISKHTVDVGGKKVVVGRISVVRFVKNKVARPWGECEMEIVFDSSALNPVVMMCQAAKSAKIIKLLKDEFRIGKDYTEDGNILETHTANIIDLADYLVRENLVESVTQSLLEYVEENPEKEIKIDKCIKELLEKPETIVSPKSGVLSNLEIQSEKVDNVGIDEQKEDNKDDDGETFEK